MQDNRYKSKKFLLPILSLVLISIIVIASISAYITTSVFKNHMNDHMQKITEEYTQKHKNRILKEVNFVNDSIEFQITRIENKLKKSLKEKVSIALSITNFTYNMYKDKLNNEEIKKKISEALEIVRFNDKRGYYFMYDNKTKVIFGHPLKKFIGRNMKSFRDIRGQSLMELDTEVLSKQKIGFSRIYFNKPDDDTKEFPKITCITKFEPLDLVIGTGEYLDVVEKETKEYVLSRFSKLEDKDKYLFILDVHDINGGDDFATVLLNKNRTDLVGKKVSDKEEDVKGNLFRKQFLSLIKEKGEGFTQYWYLKPSTNVPSLKVSYVYFQKDWNWIIGTGFYYGDLEKKILLINKSITTYINNTINKSITWVFFLSLLAILLAIFVSFKIDKTIKEYTKAIIEYEDNKREQDHMLIQQSKLAAMGEMLNNITHQWRQPLSIITTASTGARLQKKMDCLSDNQLDSTFITINNSAQYLSQTIDDFRGFFNPKNSVLHEFKIEDTLIKTLKLIDPQFNTKDIEIIKNIENYQLLSIENDLIQVLINILNNAKDVLITKEKVRRLIFINTYKKEDAFYIEIIDNAGGIEDNIIDRIFEPYFTTKDKSQGTGIGLYMSEEIVKKRLNGTLTVENSSYIYDDCEYKGAKFIIKVVKFN